MEKICSKCKKMKGFEAFYKKRRFPEYSSTAAGFSHECRDCTISRRRLYVLKYPERVKAADRKTRYGLTQDQYNEMFTFQNGKCAICEIHQSELNKPLFIDHDHKTGKTRKLLCRSCNFGLGYFKDNPGILVRASSYLISESADSKYSDISSEEELKKEG